MRHAAIGVLGEDVEGIPSDRFFVDQVTDFWGEGEEGALGLPVCSSLNPPGASHDFFP
jgi:hypothetical protein